MAAVCDVCGKKPSFGMSVSHSHRRTKRRWDPNIQRVRAVVNGAPTNSALANSFNVVAPHVLAAASQPDTGSVTDRFLTHLHNLVKVRELNETAGDDPQALVSQIEAESRRGDVAAALASFDKLPEAARKAAGDWPTLARARQAADAALQSIREAAVGQLAGGQKQ